MINLSVAGFTLCQLKLYFPEFPSLYGFRLGLTTHTKKTTIWGDASEAAVILFWFWLQVVKEKYGQNSNLSLFLPTPPPAHLPKLSKAYHQMFHWKFRGGNCKQPTTYQPPSQFTPGGEFLKASMHEPTPGIDFSDSLWVFTSLVLPTVE